MSDEKTPHIRSIDEEYASTKLRLTTVLTSLKEFQQAIGKNLVPDDKEELLVAKAEIERLDQLCAASTLLLNEVAPRSGEPSKRIEEILKEMLAAKEENDKDIVDKLISAFASSDQISLIDQALEFIHEAEELLESFKERHQN